MPDSIEMCVNMRELYFKIYLVDISVSSHLIDELLKMFGGIVQFVGEKCPRHGIAFATNHYCSLTLARILSIF